MGAGRPAGCALLHRVQTMMVLVHITEPTVTAAATTSGSIAENRVASADEVFHTNAHDELAADP